MRICAGRAMANLLTLCATVAAVSACGSASESALGPAVVGAQRTDSVLTPQDSLRREVRAVFASFKFVRPPPVRPALVALGEALAFDAILSGPKDIACMTCHQPAFATGDGRSLAVGHGGVGVGPSRTMQSGQAFTSRNAPPLFNLYGGQGFFADGRVETLADSTLRTPAGPQVTPAMTRVFEFGALSAVPMFPVLDRGEMRGVTGNELADVADGNMTVVWAALMQRLGRVPEYRAMFEAAYPGTVFDSMSFAHAANAIAGYLVQRFTFVNTPFESFIAGDNNALSQAQLLGGRQFNAHECAACHFDGFFGDNRFHNTVLPQIGPGKGIAPDPRDDYGRFNVTGFEADRYRFRTRPLLNVELTAPYGHAGQFATLEDFVEHYDRATVKLPQYDLNQLEPALRQTLLGNSNAIAVGLDQVLKPVQFDQTTAGLISEFLRALTDPAARKLVNYVPSRVPSGLPVDHP